MPLVTLTRHGMALQLAFPSHGRRVGAFTQEMITKGVSVISLEVEKLVVPRLRIITILTKMKNNKNKKRKNNKNKKRKNNKERKRMRSKRSNRRNRKKIKMRNRLKGMKKKMTQTQL